MENPASKKIAVVTGANKGIGLEICRQLCATGQVLVVLTARDEQRGLAAVDNIQASTGSSSDVLFHQLDVADSASIASFADFIRAKFGKLDILVNNAGINGVYLDDQALVSIKQQGGGFSELEAAYSQTYELAEKCISTNYYGTKKVAEALIPLLQLSQSPRIVNLTSFFGKLRCIPGKSIKEELGNIENLTEKRLDELVQSYLNDFKMGNLEENGWPSTNISAYMVSKIVISTYTRLLARRYPDMFINCVHPGYIKTDLTGGLGTQPVEEGAKGPVKLALLPDGSPSGSFYDSTEPATFE